MEFVIPEELLVNILVRLRIKDVLRSKLVCKSWLRLISSLSSGPYFTSNYAKNSPFTLILSASVSYHDDPNKLSLSLLEFAKKGGGGEYTQIPLLTPKIPDHQDSDLCLSFVGSCDCSVFILHRKPFKNNLINRVYLFNPVLGSRFKLVAEDITGNLEQMLYKVGFIPSNNTYKLLRFYPSWKTAEKVEIFTVGSDENWRKVDDDDPLLYGGSWSYDGLICFNGAYHWLSKSEYDDRIFTFHLLEERTGTAINKPHGLSRLSKMTILDGRLSLVDISKDDFLTMVIWTMKEYGVVESWSKVAVLSQCDYPDRFEERRLYYLVPIAVLANGDILFYDLSSNSGMWFYNLEERRLTPINDHPAGSSSGGSYKIYENTYVPRFYT